MLLVLPQLGGCYQFVPVGAPGPGENARVVVSLTDRGRVELAPRLGPNIRRVGGQTVQSGDRSITLSVTSIDYLTSSEVQGWTGERVEISRELIADLRERRLSRARTALFAGFVAAAGAMLSTLAISGAGGGDPGRDRPGGEDAAS